MTDRMADLMRLAAQAAAPRAITKTGLRERFGDAPHVEPAQGQVWRVRWEQDSLLVLVLTVRNRSIMGVPVTLEPGRGGHCSMLVPAEVTSFGVPATLWCDLTGWLPFRVLDRIVDEWPEDVAQSCPLRVCAPEPRRGPAVTGDDDLVEEIEIAMDVLRHVPAFAEPAAPDERVVELRTKLPNITVAQVGNALQVPKGEALAIMRGKGLISLDQAEVLARLASIDVEEVLACVPRLPEAGIAEVEHPRWRPALFHLAATTNTTESLSLIHI